MTKFGRLLLAPLAAASMLIATPSFANMLTFQGVRFDTISSGNMLTLVITNALSGGTGNWTNVNYLKAFEIKGIGDVTSVSLGAGFDSSWSYTVDQGLASAAGCTTGGTPGACFVRSPALALSDSMSFTMTFSGTNLDFSAPHLKVQFFNNLSQLSATGSLLSQTLPIPEPEIYAMLAIGLGVLGWGVHRKKLKDTTAR